MDVARQILNTQHSTTDLIDLFGKRYRIDENDQTFQWLCLNEVSNYLTFKRICEFAKHGCYCKWKRFDIRVSIKENKNLVNDIRSWSLARKLEDRVGDMCGTIENICMFRIYKLWVITSIILTKTINSKSTYQFYKNICKHLDTFDVSSKHHFIVKIDEEEHFHLVRDITNKLIMQIIKRRCIGKKMGHD